VLININKKKGHIDNDLEDSLPLFSFPCSYISLSFHISCQRFIRKKTQCYLDFLRVVGICVVLLCRERVNNCIKETKHCLGLGDKIRERLTKQQ